MRRPVLGGALSSAPALGPAGGRVRAQPRRGPFRFSAPVLVFVSASSAGTGARRGDPAWPPLPSLLGFWGQAHVLNKDLLTTEQVEMGDGGGRGAGSGHAAGRELSHREAQQGGPWNPAEAATTWQPGAAPGGPGTAPPAWGPIWAPRSGEAALVPALVGASPGCTHEGEVSSVWGLVGQGPGQTRLIPRVQHQVTSPEVTTENAVVDGSGWVTGKQVGRWVGE